MIDAIDTNLLKILQDDGRTSNAELARRVGLAASAVYERVRKLEERGLIAGYAARLSPQALGMGLLAFVFVRADEEVGSGRVGQQLAAIPEVQEVHHIAGEDCYLIKVRAPDTESLSHFLRDKVGAIPTVKTTRTTVVLRTVLESSKLPLPDEVAAR